MFMLFQFILVMTGITLFIKLLTEIFKKIISVISKKAGTQKINLKKCNRLTYSTLHMLQYDYGAFEYEPDNKKPEEINIKYKDLTLNIRRENFRITIESEEIPEIYRQFDFEINNFYFTDNTQINKSSGYFYIVTKDSEFDSNIKFGFHDRDKGTLLLTNTLRRKLVFLCLNYFSLNIDKEHVIISIDLYGIDSDLTETSLKKMIIECIDSVISVLMELEENLSLSESDLLKKAIEQETSPKVLENILEASKLSIYRTGLLDTLAEKIPSVNHQLTDIAIRYTGRLGEKKLLDWLNTEFGKAPEILTVNAMKSLKIFPEETVKKLFLKLLEQTNNAYDKMLIINEMDRMGMNELKDPCMEILKFKDYSTKVKALKLLESYGDKDVLYRLYSILNEGRLEDLRDNINNTIKKLEDKYNITNTDGRLSFTVQNDETGGLSISGENGELTIHD